MRNRLVAYLVLGTTLIQVSGSVIRARGESQPAGEVPTSIAGAFQSPPSSGAVSAPTGRPWSSTTADPFAMRPPGGSGGGRSLRTGTASWAPGPR
jgi:hypothetical protein